MCLHTPTTHNCGCPGLDHVAPCPRIIELRSQTRTVEWALLLCSDIRFGSPMHVHALKCGRCHVEWRRRLLACWTAWWDAHTVHVQRRLQQRRRGVGDSSSSGSRAVLHDLMTLTRRHKSMELRGRILELQAGRGAGPGTGDGYEELQTWMTGTFEAVEGILRMQGWM